jgi:pimeloyl-ACP methyl ester carboxylesterase
MDFLKTQEDVAVSSLQLAGISEGTKIVLELASVRQDIAKIFLFSSVARNLKESLYFQGVTRYLDYFTLLDKNQDLVVSKDELNLYQQAPTPFIANEEFPFEFVDIDQNANGLFSQNELESFLLKRYHQNITYLTTLDPFKDYYQERFVETPKYEKQIQNLTCHVSMIHGEADVQTPLSEGLLLRELMKKNPKTELQFRSFEGLGHGLSPNIGPNKLINTIGPIEDQVLRYLSSLL